MLTCTSGTFSSRGDPLQHGEPGRFLAALPGRGGDVDDQLRARADEFADGIARGSGARARNRRRSRCPRKWSRAIFWPSISSGATLSRRLEIAVLVEDVVGGQERLDDAMDDLAVLDDGGGVAQGASGPRRIAVDVAGDERDVADRIRQRVKAIEPALNEVVAQEKIAGRVAAKEKLRGEDEFRALARPPRDKPPPAARDFCRTRRWWR